MIPSTVATKVELRPDLAAMIDASGKEDPELADVMFFFDVVRIDVLRLSEKNNDRSWMALG